ncbi:MAG: prepilin-type N-terminal cleavage/methylation domain-containing protein [Geminicoccaceae bacterium]
MKRLHRRRAERGMTLIELLVAMTLLGMLMAALTGSLRLGARVWEKSGLSLDESSHVSVVSRFLKDRFEQALPIAVSEPAGADRPLFQGRRRMLRWVSTMPISVGDSPFVIELEHIEQPGVDRSGDLIMRWQPLRDGCCRPDTSVGERTLIDEVVDMQLRYFGRKSDGTGSRWHDAWEDEPRLPGLIRIDLRFQKHGQDADMTLIAAIMVDEWYDVAL